MTLKPFTDAEMADWFIERTGKRGKPSYELQPGEFTYETARYYSDPPISYQCSVRRCRLLVEKGEAGKRYEVVGGRQVVVMWRLK